MTLAPHWPTTGPQCRASPKGGRGHVPTEEEALCPLNPRRTQDSACPFGAVHPGTCRFSVGLIATSPSSSARRKTTRSFVAPRCARLAGGARLEGSSSAVAPVSPRPLGTSPRQYYCVWAGSVYGPDRDASAQRVWLATRPKEHLGGGGRPRFPRRSARLRGVQVRRPGRLVHDAEPCVSAARTRRQRCSPKIWRSLRSAPSIAREAWEQAWANMAVTSAAPMRR